MARRYSCLTLNYDLSIQLAEGVDDVAATRRKVIGS